MGGGVSRGLGRQDHQLGGGVLGEGQDRLQGARHGCRKPRGQILVQRGVTDTCCGRRKDTRVKNSHAWDPDKSADKRSHSFYVIPRL